MVDPVDMQTIIATTPQTSALGAVLDSLARRIDALEAEVGNLRRALTDHQLGEDHK